MKRRSFIVGALTLSIGGIISKMIGAIYKVPLTHILGTDGIGIYYLIFPIFSFLLTISSSGVSTALNIKVASAVSQNRHREKHGYFVVAVILTTIVSLVLSVATMLLSRYIVMLQGGVISNVSLVTIAPAIVFASIIATVRGYFQGSCNMMPTTISMIVEQVVKLVVGLVLSHSLLVYGIEYAVLGAILGVTISEGVALMILTGQFVFHKDISKPHKLNHRLYNTRYVYRKCKIDSTRLYGYILSYREIVSTIIKMVIPLTVTKIIQPIILVLDSFIVIAALNQVGYSKAIATALYGIDTGVVSTIMSMAMIVITSLTTAIIPKINSVKQCDKSISFIFKLMIVISVYMSVVIVTSSRSVIDILYGATLDSNVIDKMSIAVRLMNISSISMIYSGIIQVASIILQSIGRSNVVCIISGSLVVFREVLLILLIASGMGIYAMEIASTMYLGVSSIILIGYLKGKVECVLSRRFCIGITLLYIIGNMISYIVSNISIYNIPDLSITIISIILVTIVWVIGVIFGGIFTKKEKNMLLNSIKSG